jgi:major capsid protein Gp23
MIQPILELDPLKVCNQNRKLKAVWSMEAQQDVRAMHNIQAEGALSAIMAAEINAEIDQEILNDLRNATSPYPQYIPPPAPKPEEWGFKKKPRKQYRSIDDPWEK